MIQQAIDDFFRPKKMGSSMSVSELHQDAAQWLFSHESDYAFHVMGVNAGDARRVLLKRYKEKRDQDPPSTTQD